MKAPEINRITTIGLSALSAIALLDVLLLGYTRPPLADEGVGAHIFQLAVLSLVPTAALWLATAEWTEPLRLVRRLIFPVVLVVLAFAALYYLEHSFYPAHYPAVSR